MGQLIMARKKQADDESNIQQVREGIIEMPKALLSLQKTGFLSAHHTASEVQQILSRSGDLMAYITP